MWRTWDKLTKSHIKFSKENGNFVKWPDSYTYTSNIKK